MEDFVSIIMPAYNVGEYIEESIQSVQAQTYPNWELIVVNDGSTDTTQAVVERLASRDSRVRLVNQPNGGVSRARNRGLELARGQHISFLDGDDLWEPTFLSELLDAKKRAHVGMAYCGYDHFYAGKFRRKYRYQYPSGWILPDVIQETARLHICGILLDRVIPKTNDLSFAEDCPIGEDKEFILKLLVHTPAQAVQQSLVLYRVRPNSAITSKWDWRKHIHSIISFQRAAEYITTNIKESDQRDIMTFILRDSTASKTSKFFWRMIKNGYHTEAEKLLMQQGYKDILRSVDTHKLRPVDKIKHHIVMSHSPLLWRLAQLLH